MCERQASSCHLTRRASPDQTKPDEGASDNDIYVEPTSAVKALLQSTRDHVQAILAQRGEVLAPDEAFSPISAQANHYGMPRKAFLILLDEAGTPVARTDSIARDIPAPPPRRRPLKPHRVILLITHLTQPEPALAVLPRVPGASRDSRQPRSPTSH